MTPHQTRQTDPVTDDTARANRAWWDHEAADYYLEHGDFLGDADFVWGPEGWHEADLHLLGTPEEIRGRQLLEVGAGAAQCSRYVACLGGQVVATDLSAGMLRQGLNLNQKLTSPGARSMPGWPVVPLLQCDAVALPFADASFDTVFTAYGAIPFIADTAQVMRECARVLRPGGRLVFSTTHPIRWALPDDPSAAGLVVQNSYFDRAPYVERDESGQTTYVEHHRTLGDRVRELTAAGLRLVDLVEPEWPAANHQVWGGWSPLRGRLIPGTAIFVAEKQPVG